MQSDLVSPSVFQNDLAQPPLRLQRLYTSKSQGVSGFFEYLRRALNNFKRRIVIIKTDDRFCAGIFIRGDVKWDEDHPVNDNVAVFASTPTALQNQSTCNVSLIKFQ
jgi:hypothetical protein